MTPKVPKRLSRVIQNRGGFYVWMVMDWTRTTIYERGRTRKRVEAMRALEEASERWRIKLGMQAK